MSIDSIVRFLKTGSALAVVAWLGFPTSAAEAAYVPNVGFGAGADVVVCSPGAGENLDTLGGDDTTTGDGFVDILNFNGISVTTTGASLPNWESIVIDGGTFVFTDDALTVSSDAGAGLSIINGGRLDARTNFALTGNLILASNGIFDATGGGAGIYTISGTLSNIGILTMQDGRTGDVFTVVGNYWGNGAVNIDTVLGNSSSRTDKLVIGGDSAGTTVINITNAGGSGALTGTGQQMAFRLLKLAVLRVQHSCLAGPVTAGAYVYQLVKADNKSWYLQSSLQGQVVGYAGMRIALAEEIDTLWQRVGLRKTLLNPDGSESLTGSGYWMRSSYSVTHVMADIGTSGTSEPVNLDYSRTLMQIALEGGKPVAQGGNGLTGYALVNLVRDFGMAGGFVALGTDVVSSFAKTRIEGRLGMNLTTLGNGATFYMEAGFSKSLIGNSFIRYKGNAGVRVNF